jgi:hypothetical protein
MAVKPESSEQAVREAIERIQSAYSEHLQQIERRVKRSLSAFAVLSCIVALFLKGMPLHHYFHPWGKMALVAFVPVSGLAACDVFALTSARSLRKKAGSLQ